MNNKQNKINDFIYIYGIDDYKIVKGVGWV